MRTERGFCARRGFTTVSFSSISGVKTNVILFWNVLLEALPLPAAIYIIYKLVPKTIGIVIQSNYK